MFLPVRISPSRHPLKSGAALLIALCFLVLLSAVVLALFSSATRGRQNANAFATGQETIRLADAAINLVQGQIRDATIQPRVGWASQPGMVRAFDTSGTVTAYKLYSSDVMVVPNYGKAQIDAEFSQIKSWDAGAPGKSFNALFADLNAPAVVKRPDPSNPVQNTDTPVFPIADPAAIGAVEGFSADATVAATSLGNGTTRRLPMPVKWLYVLKDGRMTAPSGGDGPRAIFSGPVVPSAANPIVGRIAFWADDDTCKLNINTASEGVIWETPRANTFGEQRLAMSLPVQGEFQRMAGHPATTSLAPVFSNLMPPAFANNTLPLFIDPPSYSSFSTTSDFASRVLSSRNEIYERAINYFRITPRISGNLSDKSSQMGLRITVEGSPTQNALWPQSDQNKGEATALPLDSDRLYATTDEVLFAPNRTINTTSGGSTFTPQDIAIRDFFLTAHSRSPETSLLGLPRISLWPNNLEPEYRTSKDSLLEFCSRIGNDTYGFTRVVGHGYSNGATGADSPTLDAGKDRNPGLLAMLRNALSQSAPGYTSSLGSKWGGNSGIDKVLAQAFDIIRTTNIDYVQLGSVIYRYGAYKDNPASPVNLSGLSQAGHPRGFVAPTVLPSGAKGMGRSMTFSQFAVVIMPCKIRNTYTSNVTLSDNSTWTGIEESDGVNFSYTPALPSGASIPNNIRPSSQETLEVRAFLLMQPFNPTPGGANMAPGLQVQVTGSVSVNGVNIGTGTSRFGAITQERSYCIPITSLFSIQYPFFTSGATISYGPDSKDNYVVKIPSTDANLPGSPPLRGNGNPIDVLYPFVTPPIPVSGGSVSFQGGSLTVTIKNFEGTETLQKINLNFPSSVNLPAPQHLTSGVPHFAVGRVDDPPGNFWDAGSGDPDTSPGYHLSLWKRMRLNGDSNRFHNGIIRTGDIVLGLQADPSGSVGGDLRLLALSSNIPASWFVPIPGYPESGGAPAAFTGDGTSSNSNLQGRYNHAFRADFNRANWYSKTPSSTTSSQLESMYIGMRRGNQVNARTARTSSAVTIVDPNTNTPDQQTNKISTFIPNVLLSSDASAVSSAQMFNGALLGGSGTAFGDWGSANSNSSDGAVQPRYEAGIINGNLGGFYFVRGNSAYAISAGSTFEPNRQVPSAGVLGGLVTPNSSGNLLPWSTLLINPVPAAGSAHPGFGSATSRP